MPLVIADLIAKFSADVSGLSKADPAIKRHTASVRAAVGQVDKFTRATKEQITAVNRGARSTTAAQRAYDRLKSALGPTERASIKYAQSVRTIDQALRRGLITQKESNRVLMITRARFGQGAAGVGKFNLRMQELTKSVQIALGPLSGIAARITAFTALVGQANIKLAALTGGLIALGFGIFKSVGAAKDFETALIGVAKTTNLTSKELSGLGKDILDLSSELGIGAKELLNITETAGQLGIRGSKNLLNFTKVLAKLGLATDLVGPEAAKQLIRLINVTTTTVGEVGVLGAIIAGLGNQSAATEREILKLAVQIGSSTSAFKLSAQEALALAAAMASIGARAELGGSVTGRAFRAIDKAVRGSGDELKVLMKLTGMTGDQLEKTFKTNSGAVFKAFLEGLSRINKETSSVAAVLERMGLKGEEINRILPSLAENIDLVAKSFGEMAEQQEKVNALNIEVERRLESLQSKQDRFTKSLQNVAIVIGQEFVPSTRALLDILIDFLKNRDEIAGAFGIIGVALGSLLIAKVLSALFKLLARQFFVTGAAAAAAAGSITLLGRAFKLMIGPVGWIILAGEALFIFSGELSNLVTSANPAAEAMERLGGASEKLIKISTEERGKLRDIVKGQISLLNMEADAQERISVHLRNSLEDAKARFTEHSIAFKEINRQLGNSEEKFKLLKKAASDLKKQLESTVETIKKVTAPKGELLDFPKVLTDREKERIRRVKEANEQLNETIRLIEEETVAIKQGEMALKEFTRELKIQRQIQTLINKLKKEPFESEEAFLLRQAELLERITIAIKGRADAQRAALQEKVADQAEKDISALEAEISALKRGVEAYEEYKRARTIEADVDAFEKRIKKAFEEGEAVEDLIAKYRGLREELEEQKKIAKELAEEQKRLDRLAERLGATFVSAFEDAITSGKSFKDIIRALEDDVIKIILRFLLIDPIIQQIKNSMKGLSTAGGGGGGGIGGFIQSIIGGIFGGGGSGAPFADIAAAAGIFTPFGKGGVVGKSGGSGKVVPLSMFANAPRFSHGGRVGGLSPGEVPIIADRGETIRTPAQEQALQMNMTPRIIVNFNFPPGTGVDDFRRSQNQLAADASMILRSAQRNL